MAALGASPNDGTGTASSYTLNASNCNPRFISVSDSTGCSLTRASIRAFTKNDLEDQQTKEVGMDRIIAQTKEARMVGVPQRTLTDLLLSRHVNLGGGTSSNSGSVIAPFTLVPQQNVVNANYFQIAKSSANPSLADGTGDGQNGENIASQSRGGALGNVDTWTWAEQNGLGVADHGGSSTDLTSETNFNDYISAGSNHTSHGGRQRWNVTMADEAMGTISSTATLTGYKSQLTNLGRFFTPGSYILLENLDDASGANAQNVVFKVIES